MNISIVNSLWALLTGEKLPLNDPKLQDIVEKLNAFFNNSSDPSAALASFFPYPPMIHWSILKPFRDAVKLDLESLSKSLSAVTQMATDQITKHQIDASDDDINDFIDAYFAEIRKQESEAFLVKD